MLDFVKEIAQVVGPWTILFCLFVGITVELVRRLTERVMWKTANETWLWNEVVLYVLPLLVGGGAALVWKTYPFQDHPLTTSARFVIGIVCGGFSGFAYRMAKAVLKKLAAGQGIDVSVDTPPPGGGA